MSSERLKAATRRLVKTAGGQEAVTQITRVKHHSTIGRYGRPQDAEFAPIDVIAAIEDDVGEPFVTRELADLAGYLLVAKDRAAGARVTVGDLGALLKEAGGVSSGLADALSDGVVSPEEATQLRPCVRQLQEVLASLEASLGRVV